MKKIEIKKIIDMVYKISIDGETYMYTGTLEEAERIKKNLDFVFNI